MANNNLDLVELDPDSLKTDFKNWLRDNDQFKDFNFEGSNMNLLLDLFAYNTYKNAFFTNMGISEAFLDSAQLRSSIFSHCKHLNYLPDSHRSARARIRVSFEATGETAPYTVAKGSPFTAIIKNDSYTFTVPSTITVASANTTYEFETDIYEGIFLKDTYTMSSSSTQPFPITNKNIDTDSLTVTVFEDGNEVGDTYIYSSTLLGVDDKSKVFFLQPCLDGSYEVIFGDSNTGRRPKVNSTVVLEYRVSSGLNGNGGKIFSLDFDPTENDEMTTSAEIATLQVSRNGRQEESDESIKFLAPRHFQTQERAINPKDYEIILKKEFPEINDIHAYGGEDLVPPEPGKVFISLDLTDITGLPESKKNQYTKFLLPRRGFGTSIFFKEPEYSYVQVNTKVRYNSNITKLSGDSIKTIIRDEVLAFRDENLDKFDAILRHSKLESVIDNSDDSIVSSFCLFNVYKTLDISLGATTSQEVFFGVEAKDLRIPIPKNHDNQYQHACYSSEFYHKNQLCRIEDDSNGNMWLVRIAGTQHNYLLNVGTIDYSIGAIQLQNLRIDSLVGNTFKIFINPVDQDFRAYRNNVLTIDPTEINITLEELRI